MYQYAKALWFDHSLRMNPPIRWGEYEHVVPQWSIGLSLAYAPLLAVLSNTIFSADTSIRKIPDPSITNYSHRLLYDPHYQYCSLLNPVITALSAAVLYLLCLQLGLSNKKAGAAALTFGLFSPATVYSKLDFAQPLVTLFILLAFLFLLKAEATRRGFDRSMAGICLGLAVLSRSEFMIIAPLLVLSVYFIPARVSSTATNNPIDTLKNLLWFALPLCAIVLVNQGINFLKFGSWLSTGYPLAYYLTFDLKHWSTAFAGNLISPGRGVLLFFPLSILSITGFRKLVTIDRWFATTLLIFLCWEFIFYPIWRTWDGGISWGPRYLIPVMPYLSLLAYVALPPVMAIWRRFIVVLLLAFGAIGALQGLLFGFEFYGSLGLTSAQLEQQLYHFSFPMSPLFAGWKGLLQPASYDIKWVHLDPGTKIGLLWPFTAVLCLALLTRFWFNFFRASDIDEIVCDVIQH